MVDFAGSPEELFNAHYGAGGGSGSDGSLNTHEHDLGAMVELTDGTQVSVSAMTKADFDAYKAAGLIPDEAMAGLEAKFTSTDSKPSDDLNAANGTPEGDKKPGKPDQDVQPQLPSDTRVAVDKDKEQDKAEDVSPETDKTEKLEKVVSPQVTPFVQTEGDVGPLQQEPDLYRQAGLEMGGAGAYLPAATGLVVLEEIHKELQVSMTGASPVTETAAALAVPTMTNTAAQLAQDPTLETLTGQDTTQQTLAPPPYNPQFANLLAGAGGGFFSNVAKSIAHSDLGDTLAVHAHNPDAMVSGGVPNLGGQAQQVT